jgi:TATA-box binding protein (TBP) (component of TFIID and TFIIIB)
MATNNVTMPSPSPLKISTITATAMLDVSVNLDAFFDGLKIRSHLGVDGIEYAEYGVKKGEARRKPELAAPEGLSPTNKNGKPRRGAREKKRFDNQVTVIVRHGGGGVQKANAKVFRNGHIQITGLKSVEDGMSVVRVIVDAMEAMPGGESKLMCKDYRVRLINSDFRLGFEVRRDALQRLAAHKYRLPCSFEPCIYPGCKIQFWYNKNNAKKDGRCGCMENCDGKGSGKGDGQCKKVTIAVFHSGSVIITGGQSRDQIDEAYAFICGCVADNYETVRRSNQDALMALMASIVTQH